VTDHLGALQAQLDAALAEVSSSATAARAVLEGDLEALHAMEPQGGRPPLIADVPVDEPPPYVPPPSAPAANALIPDTPLVDGASSTLAFDDDAPLWQN
jgi:hypothetical protein